MQKLKFKEQTLQRFLLFLLEYDIPVLFSDLDETLFDNTYIYIIALRGSNGITAEEKKTVLTEKFGTYFVK